jgi:hypothetical protein
MFGTDIGAVTRTRSYAGEVNAGFAGEVKKSRAAEQTAPVSIKVEATLESGVYTLVVSAEGQSATRSGVEPADLADTLASIIDRLSKHAAAGDLRKHREPESPVRMGSAHNFTRKSPSEVFSG